MWYPLLALLDGVEDPYNFGQALRSLYAAGVDGVILNARDWQSAAGVVARASAGASERLALAKVESIGEAISFAQATGLTVACSEYSRRALSCYEVDLTVPLLLLLGGEKRGIASKGVPRRIWPCASPMRRAVSRSGRRRPCSPSKRAVSAL